MKKNTLRKCPYCGNISEFSYEGSRNLNSSGDLRDIIQDKELWVSYYKCPNCKKYDIDMHPVGEKPNFEGFKDITEEVDKILKKDKSVENNKK